MGLVSSAALGSSLQRGAHHRRGALAGHRRNLCRADARATRAGALPSKGGEVSGKILEKTKKLLIQQLKDISTYLSHAKDY